MFSRQPSNPPTSNHPTPPHPTPGIAVESLAVLCFQGSVSLQKTAVQLLLDRAMRHADTILQQLQHTLDPDGPLPDGCLDADDPAPQWHAALPISPLRSDQPGASTSPASRSAQNLIPRIARTIATSGMPLSPAGRAAAAAAGLTPRQALQLRAVTALGLLLKNASNQSALLARGCLPLLLRCLSLSTPVVVQRVVLLALFDLVREQREPLMHELVRLDGTATLVAILATTSSKDVTYWAAVLFNHLASVQRLGCYEPSLSPLSHPIPFTPPPPLLTPSLPFPTQRLRPAIANVRAVRCLSQVVCAGQGNQRLQKLCIHTLVLLTASNTPDGNRAVLEDLARRDVVTTTIGCLSSDDPELLYWALCLLHELALKDIGRDTIRDCPGLVWKRRRGG